MNVTLGAAIECVSGRIWVTQEGDTRDYSGRCHRRKRFVPHAAFDHPHIPPNAPLRESIEIRCLVVFA
ncbi:MAG: DUF2917 domain-containing protein [Burkholderiales bacterium]